MFIHLLKISKKQIRKDKEIFLFLKRVYLCKHFLFNLNEIQSKFIDWDEILSVSNLSSKFNISISHLNEDFEFKPIVFAKLPKEFIKFGNESFNFPIIETLQVSVYNILDYNNLINTFDDFDPDLKSN